jgi:hypothetical protein
MSRKPIVPSHTDAESALSDLELDGVVGGTAQRCPKHPTESLLHVVDGPQGTSMICYGR